MCELLALHVVSIYIKVRF